MTKKLALVIALFGGLVAGTIPALAQQSANPIFPSNVGGRLLASEYGKWVVTSLSSMTAGTASTVSFAPCFIHVGNGNRQVFPFWALGNTALNVPVQIQDGSSSETVYSEGSASYPVAAPVSSPQPYACSFTITPVNAHNAGVIITSGDGGLMEAVNDALSQGIGEVDLDSGYTGLTPSNTNLLPITPLVSIADVRGGVHPPYWTLQSTSAATTSTGAPATRVAAATCPTPLVATTVCDSTVAVASGGFTNAAQFVWVAYVDMLGGVSQASATANYTSAGALSIFFSAPAAATGQVGYIVGVGTTYAAAYWFPMTSSYCTLTVLETIVPACAISNTVYGQAASSALIPKPLTTFALHPVSGGLANVYNPNTLNHTTFGYQPSSVPSQGIQLEYGPFAATPALTAGQLGVAATIPLPAGFLNWIGRDIELHGKFAYTPTTGGTAPEIAVEIGDITDFTTGTPKILCTELETHTTTTVAYSVDFTCTLQTNATGATGSIMPGGFLVDGTQAGTTAAVSAPEQATAAITADVLDQDLLYVVFLQTSSAETAGVQLLKLDLKVVQ